MKKIITISQKEWKEYEDLKSEKIKWDKWNSLSFKEQIYTINKKIFVFANINERYEKIYGEPMPGPFDFPHNIFEAANPDSDGSIARWGKTYDLLEDEYDKTHTIEVTHYKTGKPLGKNGKPLGTIKENK